MIIVKENDKELEIKLEGEKPTILMLIKEELDKMPEVIISAWREEHPLLKNVYFYIKTDGSKKPREVFIEAIQRCIERIDIFEKNFKKLFK